MGEVKYTVSIRTLGTALDKLATTLRCVIGQTIKPEKIQIVIPYGYQLNISELIPLPPGKACHTLCQRIS